MPRLAIAQRERARLRAVGLRQLLDALRALRGDQRAQLGVLLAVGDRVEPQQRAPWWPGGSSSSRSRRRSSPSPCADRIAIEPASSCHRAASSGVGVVADLGEAGEVRVRVEDHDAQARPRAAAARARARASSSCPTPTARTGTCGGRTRRRRAPRARRRPARASPTGQARGPRAVRSAQRAHLVRRGRPCAAVVERAGRRRRARRPRRPRAGSTTRALSAPVRAGEPDRAGLRRRRLERADLPESRLAVVALEHHVAAELELEPVQRGLERERPPVDRAGERQDGLLELRAQRAELLEVRAGRRHRRERPRIRGGEGNSAHLPPGGGARTPRWTPAHAIAGAARRAEDRAHARRFSGSSSPSRSPSRAGLARRRGHLPAPTSTPSTRSRWLLLVADPARSSGRSCTGSCARRTRATWPAREAAQRDVRQQPARPASTAPASACDAAA